MDNERVNMVSLKKIMRSLGRSLEHIHEHGRIHGDFNPSNAVRMADGQTWCTIDLDGSVPIGSPALKPSVYSPPEFTMVLGDHHDRNHGGRGGRVVFKIAEEYKGSGVFGDQIEPLLGAPSFDCWSFGVVLYKLLARRNLFSEDDHGNPDGEYSMNKLHDWGPDHLSKAVFRCHQTMRNNKHISTRDRFLACDLLGWLLQRNPTSRPLSMNAAITHPFLIGAQYVRTPPNPHTHVPAVHYRHARLPPTHHPHSPPAHRPTTSSPLSSTRPNDVCADTLKRMACGRLSPREKAT